MFHFILGKQGFAVSTTCSSIMKVNNFKQTLKYSLLCVRIMQLRENSNFLTKKKAICDILSVSTGEVEYTSLFKIEFYFT